MNKELRTSSISIFMKEKSPSSSLSGRLGGGLLCALLLTACSSSELSNVSDTAAGNPDGAIALSAGIVEGGSALTRAGAEDHHSTPGHLNLTNGTKLALRVSGTWTGHGTVPATDANLVYKTTTATVGAKTGTDNLHNAVSTDPVLYWDDYGTADPANIAGRTAGLTIYGAAVNGETSIPADLNSIKHGETDADLLTKWENLSWTLPANQSSGWNSKDLLISNNVSTSGLDGTYKFNDYIANPTTYTKLLEFTHAMSKITVNLKADEGFNGSFSSTEVKLVNTEGANPADNASWAYTEGTVNITNGTVSKTASTQKVITMAQATTATTGYTVTKEALVMPQSEFTADDAIIARVVADGNIYYVKAKEIRDKISAMSLTTGGQYLTKPGYNYIINVKVKKTKIEVTATITNWTDVESAEVTPTINVTGNYGTEETAFTEDKTFSFYRSESLNNGYLGTSVNDYLPEESVVSYDHSTNTWSMTPALYWQDHNTHYQFRGVMPRTVTTTGDVTSPRVESVTHEATDYQVIKVQNVAYNAGTFPSDLMIGRPEIDAATTCSNDDHDAKSLYNVGICATEGKINLNFRYMMSKVEVNLSTNTGATDAVELTGATVEIVGAYTSGNVKLGDRGILFLAENTKGNYTLNTVAGVGNENKRLSAIVPQSLEGVKFKITLANGDVYYADVAPIKKTDSSDLVAPNGKWENGVHYVYNLKITKTKVNVTATLTDWKTVTASENVWF